MAKVVKFDKKLTKQVIKKQNVDTEEINFALTYISYYFHNPAEGELTQERIADYVKSFQDVIGVPADGELSTQLVKAMQFMPRCGCKDYSEITPQAAGAKWGLKEVSYYVQKYVGGISQPDQLSLLQTAFDQWSAFADIRAKRVTSPEGANIIVSTGRGSADQFDGPGNTLAWAYLPPQFNFRGQLLMKFDIDEMWITRATDRGILYLNVACHEIGHLLGLEHSQRSGALMAPYYSTTISKPQQNDDVSRIVNLYGAATTPPTPPTIPPTTPPVGGVNKIEIELADLSKLKVNGKSIINFDLI